MFTFLVDKFRDEKKKHYEFAVQDGHNQENLKYFSLMFTIR